MITLQVHVGNFSEILGWLSRSMLGLGWTQFPVLRVYAMCVVLAIGYSCNYCRRTCKSKKPARVVQEGPLRSAHGTVKSVHGTVVSVFLA